MSIIFCGVNLSINLTTRKTTLGVNQHQTGWTQDNLGVEHHQTGWTDIQSAGKDLLINLSKSQTAQSSLLTQHFGGP